MCNNFSMALSLESQENLLVLVSGMYHENEKENFRMSCIGLTRDGFLVVYNDHNADMVANGNFYYNIKRKINLSNISNVILEDIYYSQKFYHPHRINVVGRTKEDSLAFYFNSDQQARVNAFIKLIKTKKIKVTKRDFHLD